MYMFVFILVFTCVCVCTNMFECVFACLFSLMAPRKLAAVPQRREKVRVAKGG